MEIAFYGTLFTATALFGYVTGYADGWVNYSNRLKLQEAKAKKTVDDMFRDGPNG